MKVFESKMSMSHDCLKKWDIVKTHAVNRWAVVHEVNHISGSLISEYSLIHLNISRWWILRKIQLWAIKRAFK